MVLDRLGQQVLDARGVRGRADRPVQHMQLGIGGAGQRGKNVGEASRLVGRLGRRHDAAFGIPGDANRRAVEIVREIAALRRRGAVHQRHDRGHAFGDSDAL